jgi:hypothetical protein
MCDLLNRLGEAIATLEKRKGRGESAPSPSLPSPTSPALAAPAKTEEAARSIQDSLSGGLGVRIAVCADGGEFLAKVPVTVLRSSGVRLVESALPEPSSAKPAAVIATESALRNAEHRLMRILGEGWEASAKTFAAPPEETIWFSLVRRTSPT